MFYLEQLPVRGYQSSVDPVMHLGLGTVSVLDSLRIIWPDDRTGLLTKVKVNQTLLLDHNDAKNLYHYPEVEVAGKLFDSEQDVLEYMHHQNKTDDFNRQVLLPHFYSNNGPCMAKADVNGDGLDDIYVGGSKGNPGALFLQTRTHRFLKSPQPAILADSASPDADALFFDANGDHQPDLYIVSGGYDDLVEGSSLLQDRLYLNDGRGHFFKSKEALPVNHGSKSCVRAADIDGDGDVDLFIGGNGIPGRWPFSCPSAIYINDGKGRFTDATNQWYPGLKTIGMVTDAVWADVNQDGLKDLMIVGEWMQPVFLINRRGYLQYADENKQLTGLKGWWNRILASDLNGDGKVDFVIGNYGLNSPLKATIREPVQLYVADLDGNEIPDPVMTTFVAGKSYPFAAMDDILKQIPALRKKFNDYPAYADATISDVFTLEKLSAVKPLEATNMETLWLQNTGHGFIARPLPTEAQYAPVYSILSKDLNGDGFDDLILFGNHNSNRIRLGRLDANHGQVFINDGKGHFSFLSSEKTGMTIRGEVRSALFIGAQLFIGMNNDSLKTFLLRPKVEGSKHKTSTE